MAGGITAPSTGVLRPSEDLRRRGVVRVRGHQDLHRLDAGVDGEQPPAHQHPLPGLEGPGPDDGVRGYEFALPVPGVLARRRGRGGPLGERAGAVLQTVDRLPLTGLHPALDHQIPLAPGHPVVDAVLMRHFRTDPQRFEETGTGEAHVGQPQVAVQAHTQEHVLKIRAERSARTAHTCRQVVDGVPEAQQQPAEESVEFEADTATPFDHHRAEGGVQIQVDIGQRRGPLSGARRVVEGEGHQVLLLQTPQRLRCCLGPAVVADAVEVGGDIEHVRRS